ncbi:membrane fusion protein (multidrug efflux system) [Bradyrhizobium sp. USDA 4532]|uniref:HlyD family secretion protein n=2 Tax=Bradyrhizobium brasilense TaxID=1419277 RepID=A0ABY8J7N0_9BRAD|nr:MULTISPECIES: HlyD family secretion protein [Bradyrhizobium]MCP1834340.1 membrane fusion protein (multidrug efflux system) [Bradyrhizobium sp. USDA 4545]MCP1919086.1 membrane fusion protein (multidrug efflux system) [Bradyrhizobium sp. USDA 4532]OMI01279.1 hemolysin D [Bradyrhizobium brasilense]WFU61550.1 HlyD family secretion protein [Bradyrhizobium brasilense]
MSQHETSFKAESQVPAETARQLIAHPEAARPPAAKGRLRRLLLTGAALAVLSGGAWYGWDYWTVGRFQVSTDDAYVKADNTTIAPKVSGYLSAVLVGDNEHVRAGQMLARIDDRDFRVALDQAKADVAAAEAAIASKHAQLDVQQSVIEAARATLAVDTATQTFAEQENKRYTDLAGTGFGSVQNAQQAQSRYASAQAAVARDTANLASALRQVELLKADIAQAVASQARATALQHQAELNLGYTTISAPIDGVVGNRTLRTGQFVQAGTQLMSLVPATGAYVIANYKETQLTNVRKGQPVEIAVDMFPGQVVRGHVDSLAPASGQEFALLPPDNATGNFTKVVQRIPVKIALDATAVELRPGMSVIPTIATLSQPGEAPRSGASPKLAVASFK